jgi:hypothetical protein
MRLQIRKAEAILNAETNREGNLKQRKRILKKIRKLQSDIWSP